ncbi:electron transport complex subunit RsxE [Candidatus Margulisiibacteriota bacterium]
MKKHSNMYELVKGIWRDNPVMIQLLGLCPTLAVTNTVSNGIAMGLATSFVLISSNIMISIIRSLIPKEVRIAAYIVVIATFVTMADIFLKANFMEISKALGPFVPLIVVNCLILGRAEAFASKNNPVKSFFDGLGMGIGFTIALLVISAVREILGNGTFLGLQVMFAGFKPWLIMILPPGAFLVMGFLVAAMQLVREKE